MTPSIAAAPSVTSCMRSYYMKGYTTYKNFKKQVKANCNYDMEKNTRTTLTEAQKLKYFPYLERGLKKCPAEGVKDGASHKVAKSICKG